MLEVLEQWLKGLVGIDQLNLDVFESSQVKRGNVYGVCMRGKSGGVILADMSKKFKANNFDTLLLYADGNLLKALNTKRLYTNGRFSYISPIFKRSIFNCINVLEPDGTNLFWDVTLNRFF